VDRRAPPRVRGGAARAYVSASAGDSEQELLFGVIRERTSTHVRRTLGAFDGQLQDQQGLVEATVVELRRSAQGFGDQAVSDFEFFEDGKLQ